MIEVKIPVPPEPILENALGYWGTARWIATWWEPAGDEAMLSDGQLGRTGSWEAFVLYTKHCSPRLGDYDLGWSENTAKDWLIIDRLERKAYVAPWREASKFLQSQWPAQELVHLSEEQWQELVAEIEKEMKAVRPLTNQEIEAMWEQSLEALAALRAWLNQN